MIVSDLVSILTFPWADAEIKLLLILSNLALILFEKIDIGPLKTSFTSPSLVAIFFISSKEINFLDCSLNFFDSIDWVSPFKRIIFSLKLYLAKLDLAFVSWLIII